MLHRKLGNKNPGSTETKFGPFEILPPGITF